MFDTMTPGSWREDLDWLAAAILREHVRPHHTISPDGFRDVVASIRRRLPALPGHAVPVALARLLAAIGDGHTAVWLHDVAGYGSLPVTIGLYEDGTWITGAAPEHADLIGCRLVAIDGVPIGTVLESLRPAVSRDNGFTVLARLPGLLVIPEVLHAVGVAHDPGSMRLAVVRSGGALETIRLDRFPGRLHLVSLESESTWRGNGFARVPGPVPTVHLRYDAVRDDPGRSLADLFGRLFEVIKRDGIRRLIVDVRRNGGGNMALNAPLVDGLVRCERVNHPGGLFVITGRQTFSAAMNLCAALEQRTHARFVGEPTGTAPNHYGENGSLVLPNSQIAATVSTLFWQTSLPYDDRPWIAPDLPVAVTYADERAGRDAALEAITGWVAGPDELLHPSIRLLRRIGRADLLPSPDQPDRPG
ncbi:MAG TPA: hypothetical protein VGT61_12395 [Thermomicrobiales bacterium]|nr:hypothetical protein [Thermomicrobiales bacterium]